MRPRRSWSPSSIAVAGGLLVSMARAIASPGSDLPAEALRQAGPPAPPEGLLGELEALTEGLTLMSEADFPLEIVTWRRPGGTPSATRLGALTGQPHPEHAQTMTVDDFFRNAARRRPADEAEARAVVRRFGCLVHFLETRLAGVRVFRFGHLTLRAYIVGMTADGSWVGLAVTQIET